jgi:hypothetical protein
MSRFKFAIALSIVASLSSAALAERSTPFGRPPVSVAAADIPDGYSAPVRLDRAAIRAKLAQNRAANLARFRVYQKKGVFPNNTYTDGKLNVWLDEYGNLCAAATIIKLSGQDDLVQRTADQSNFIRLADVTQGPLMDWILTSGLTQDEIAAIQEPMMPVVMNPGVEPAVEPAVEPMPEPIVVDGRMRRIENRRLIQKYKQVDAQIVKARNKSLDAATDRLLSNPDVASKFLAS